MVSVLSPKVMENRYSDEFPPLQKNSSGHLGRKKIKQILSTHVGKENVNKINLPTTTRIKKGSTSHSSNDLKMIKTALGVSELHTNQLKEKDKQDLDTLVKAASLEIAEVRKTTKQVAMGGFKKAGIKKWKFVVQMDASRKITDLFIGQYKAHGSYTKVYLTVDQAILVPKKMASSDRQLFLAYENISKIHAVFTKMEDFDRATNDEFALFNYSKEEFINLLPALPKKIQVGSRLVLIAPKATCVSEKFKFAPTDLEEIIHRIEILRDVTLGVALMHYCGFVHGDLKPDNMLMDHRGRAQPHDIGGGNFFLRKDNQYESMEKYYGLTQTALYRHYNDYEKMSSIKMVKGDEFYQLGCAADVFALGVSTIEALTGLESRNGSPKYPFDSADYYIDHGRQFVGDSSSPREFWCVEEVSYEIDTRLKQILAGALHHDHECRPSALEFAEDLHEIAGLLKEVDDV